MHRQPRVREAFHACKSPRPALASIETERNHQGLDKQLITQCQPYETSELHPHIHRNPGHRIHHEQFAITIERHLRGHGVTVYSASSATEQERARARARVPTDLDVISIDQELTGWDGEESGRGDEAPWYLDVKRAGRGALGDHASCCDTR
jgi:hypothetical protein